RAFPGRYGVRVRPGGGPGRAGESAAGRAVSRAAMAGRGQARIGGTGRVGRAHAVRQWRRPMVAVGNMEEEGVGLCRDLIRIDSSNAGDNRGPGEREAAEYVAEKLSEVGLEPRILESSPRRASVIARIEGTDPGRDALLLHGHLDVVPFDAGDW